VNGFTLAKKKIKKKENKLIARKNKKNVEGSWDTEHCRGNIDGAAFRGEIGGSQGVLV